MRATIYSCAPEGWLDFNAEIRVLDADIVIHQQIEIAPIFGLQGPS